MNAEQELAQYVGYPRCQDCGWKLGSEITNNCDCLVNPHKPDISDEGRAERYRIAFARARELQAMLPPE